MKEAEILAIGDELLSGETVDTNSSFLDQVLERWGWSVIRHTTVRDRLDHIADAFQVAARRANLVISTGGLGPTQDDLTLAGLAQALGCGLVEHRETLARIERMFEAIGREMTPNNRRQAMVPEQGEVVLNEVGTAPAFACTLNGAQIFLMPGVPREVRWLVENQLPKWVERGEPAVFRRTLKVIGMGESRLEHAIADIVSAHQQVRFGYRTQGLENHIKLAAEEVDQIQKAEADLVASLGLSIFGAGRRSAGRRGGTTPSES